ncbi:MAG: acyl transferase [Bacteroidia bacterium]|nr:acyl transferase [Bacteroidia bacterium]MDW8303023.1 acyl transferase [Bacteroidia bacterium]
MLSCPFWQNSTDWNTYFIELFHFHKKYNPVYAHYLQLIKYNSSPQDYTQIPTLPITLFRKHAIYLPTFKPTLHFESSSTTQSIPSKHYVIDLEYYHQSIIKHFRSFFTAEKYTFLCLLPGYLERPHASLVYMMKYLIEQFGTQHSGFFIHDFESLKNSIEKAIQNEENIFLIGVSFALLDFAAKYPIALPSSAIVMETGGMKGRKKEWIRQELHEFLKQQFQIHTIYAEYGMTELLSQAYCYDGVHFHAPAWMRIYTTEINDPFTVNSQKSSGVLNIIDAANLYSCPFIQTQDIGKVYENGSFEVLGRLDYSELRGCNLMYVL